MKVKKHIGFVGIVAVVLSAAMVSCEKAEPGKTPKPDEKSTVTIVQDQESLASRVTVYGQSTRTRAKGQDSGYKMPDVPNVPANAIVMDENFGSWQVKKNQSYIVPETGAVSVDLKMDKGVVYYVKGSLETNNIWGGGETSIVILPGGVLTVSNFHTLPNGLTITNFGELNLPTDLTMGQGSVVENGAQMNSFNRLNVEGTCYTAAALKTRELTVSQKGTLVLDCSADVQTEVVMSNESIIRINYFLTTPHVTMSNQSMIELRSGAYLQVRPGSDALFTDGQIEMANPQCRIIQVDGDDYAVVEAENLVIYTTNAKPMVNGWIDIHCKEITNLSGKNIEWLSDILFDGPTYLAPSDCRPEFGTNPDKGGEPEPTDPDVPNSSTDVRIQHVAEVSIPATTLSATCVQLLGDRVYVSYHTQGEPYGGFIDIFDLPARSLIMGLDAKRSDFNHLIVEQDRLITVGGEARGALLWVMPMSGGLFASNEMTTYGLEGASGNCVVRNGSHFLTASNTGFEVLDGTYKQEKFLEAPYAKHIDINGPRMATLHGVDNAQSILYESSDYTMSSPLRISAAGIISPINGKNVIRVEGDRTYICMGDEGLAVYDKGTEVYRSKVGANGVDIDSKYIYVACGTNGLYIRDKATFQTVACYTHTSASANYVKVMPDGYVSVAYGLRGWQLFKVVEY